MNDDGRPAVPHPPYDELRGALGDSHEGSPAIDALQSELHADAPDAGAVAQHASLLRGIPVLEARIANWWDDPDTQRWVKALSDSGL